MVFPSIMTERFKGSPTPANVTPLPRHEKLTMGELVKVLEDPRLARFFHKFLTVEYSQENLDFYKAAIAYRKAPSLETCRHIIDTYVKAYAPQQVNIAADTREDAVQKALAAESRGSPDWQVFNNTLETVLTIMYQDSFPRFIRSNIYGSYLAEIEAASSAHLYSDCSPDVLLTWLLHNRKDKKTKQFHQFLQRVCAEENILFWWACDDLFKAKDRDEMILCNGSYVTKTQKRAEKIYEDFIREGAPCWLNVDESHRKGIEGDIARQRIGHGFVAAQEAIFSLMLNDPFLKFLQQENPFPERYEIEPHGLSIQNSKSAPSSRSGSIQPGSGASSLPPPTTNFLSLDHIMQQAQPKQSKPSNTPVPTEEPTNGTNSGSLSSLGLTFGPRRSGLLASQAPAMERIESSGSAKNFDLSAGGSGSDTDWQPENEEPPQRRGSRLALSDTSLLDMQNSPQHQHNTAPGMMCTSPAPYEDPPTGALDTHLLVEQLREQVSTVEREKELLRSALVQQRRESSIEIARLRAEVSSLQRINAELRNQLSARDTEIGVALELPPLAYPTVTRSQSQDVQPNMKETGGLAELPFVVKRAQSTDM
eukprot:comp23435_c0_seq2/m.39032 comp23435_c0_seq2/g.39032  ORF comp23435_c0_seq2/g.39032 comp23435_c0_seq2/m.39032 type:complete len:593 (-) comp23435_c0_seq2:350-2128(-)